MPKYESIKTLASAAFAAALIATPAAAADLMVKAPPAVAPAPASMWYIAFGALIQSDYNFRGISQSDRGPSVGAYFEPRFKLMPNLEVYLGVGGLSVKLPTTPTAEIDFYGGLRATVGQFSADIGAIYYYYPKETIFGTAIGTDTDFWEVYGKFGFTFNDYFAVGASIFHSPDWLKTGASGTYVSGTAKVTAPGGMIAPDVGMYVSGEFGHYFFGTPSPGFAVFDYNYWNVGGGFTYKAFTLDLRYHDTDLTRAECQAMTGDPWAAAAGTNSRWCSSAFIAKLSVDTTLSALR
jgi:uncharacterized protein (TIGR02001 family)